MERKYCVSNFGSKGLFPFVVIVTFVLVNLPGCAVDWATAADRGDTKLAKELIFQKEQLNESDVHLDTPLLWAVKAGETDIVEFLIRENADINKKNPITGETALIYAVKENHDNILNILIVAGADSETRDNSGLSALDWASRRGNKEVVLALLGRQSRGTLLNNGNALVYAVYSGDLDTIGLLLDKGARIDAPDTYGDTPFFAAIKSQDVEIVKLLIELGAEFRTVDGIGQSPLMLTARIGNIDVASYLLTIGAEVNEQNELGFSPLMSAAANNQSAMVDYLLSKGSDSNLRENTGLSATYFAAENTNVDVIVRLLEEGANLSRERQLVMDDNPYATAFMYEVAGDYFLGLNGKNRSVEFYDLAQSSFEILSDRYANQARKESTKELFKMAGKALAMVALAAAEQQHAQTQASYQAQLSSLSQSSSVGEYHQRLATSLPIYEQNAQIASDARIESYGKWLFSDVSANTVKSKEAYSRLSQKAADKAEQIEQMTQCIKQSAVSNIQACHHSVLTN